jgi:hypothetical protein
MKTKSWTNRDKQRLRARFNAMKSPPPCFAGDALRRMACIMDKVRQLLTEDGNSPQEADAKVNRMVCDNVNIPFSFGVPNFQSATDEYNPKQV